MVSVLISVGRRPLKLGTYLLQKHNQLRRNQGTPIAGNGDHFEYFILAEFHCILGLQQCVHVEQVTGSLDLVKPQTTH